jgi:hypothetical protein
LDSLNGDEMGQKRSLGNCHGLKVRQIKTRKKKTSFFSEKSLEKLIWMGKREYIVVEMNCI